ncbi:hypothetical protein NP233_g10145 [Leucocoprinus birnbaumii]|uniref:Uncharacterized protein n=1 Tax=Leucocoprinus birnbaumii TaxID=56174 RepID=A0AAD5VJJ4_9AGAR|nr:hypothetical protein NP233_g10145 [Leucocoprinus birnbaumii]
MFSISSMQARRRPHQVKKAVRLNFEVLDLWYEIMRYFDSKKDRKTLLSLALCSSSMLEIALAALWRESSLKPLVYVINSHMVEGARYSVRVSSVGENRNNLVVVPHRVWSATMPEEARLHVQYYLSFDSAPSNQSLSEFPIPV